MKTHELKHLSIRVPWHDQGWNGTVCKCPSRNTSCLKLKNIADSKDEQAEDAIASQSIKDLLPTQVPPCVKERGTFMADFAFLRDHNHPYVASGKKSHTHFRAASLRYPSYSAAGLPFRWMRRDFVFGDAKQGLKALRDIFALEEVEERLEPDLGFPSGWVQDHRNQRALLDAFWQPVKSEESLVFFYAKQVPLVEDTGRRAIVGVGRVKAIGDLTEYTYDGEPGDRLRSLIWERMVGHSIRPGWPDGFLMPYHQALEEVEKGATFDPAEVVAFAPEERFVEFAYATEHVGHDAAIAALLSCRAALIRASELFAYDRKRQEEWIDRELGRLWKKRGPYPGLGSVLIAMGVSLGNFVASALQDKVGDDGDAWAAWNDVVTGMTRLPDGLADQIDETIMKAWQRMSAERRQYLELLSRLDLNAEQAKILTTNESRSEAGIDHSDEDFIANPYLYYESTRLSESPLALGVVDRGMFPTPFIRERFPLPEASRVKTEVDARRLRALVVCELEAAALLGDTLLARDTVVASLRRKAAAEGEIGVEVTADLLIVAEEDLFEGVIERISMADGSIAYQLVRLARVGELIRETVEKRVTGNRHVVDVDWRAELDSVLGHISVPDEDRENEELAREEKVAALKELAESRISVLAGPAGTGKTTLLSVLCSQPDINSGGILLLAPTGKARVRLESVTKKAGIQHYEAFTLAQFLSKTKRFVGKTQRYVLTGEEGGKGARTVIVDECSMLTEEMLAALFEALSGVHRLILVGDPRQLPPIGAGRPFVDIVARLQPTTLESSRIQVGPNYAALTVPRRQGAGEREDLQLAAWYGGGAAAPGEDQVFEILSGRRTSDYIRFVKWDTPEQLEKALPEALSQSLHFAPEVPEDQAFALTFGGWLDPGGSPWFGCSYKDKEGSGPKAENWQILCPVRQKQWGVDALNRLVQRRYMARMTDLARKWGYAKKIPSPMGDAQIVYGNKVINNRNTLVYKKRIYPEPEQGLYLANGEIGMVVGHRKSPKKDWEPKYIEVEYSTQPGHVFKYYDSDFGDEGDASLELAYALTVHKAQGSEFGTVFLVLPKSSLAVTRELLYTALTRQKDKIVVLHQGSAVELQELSAERFSSVAARLTNLFGPPNPVKVGDKFLERRLIHVTSRGDAVRSKSEVIIADNLHSLKVSYHYEAPLTLGGDPKYPDFTIEDDDTGTTYYWEHCGMMGVPSYRRRWEEKQVWYRDNDILPYEEGGGRNGTLIVTEDTLQGGISSKDIRQLIETVILKRTPTN